MNQKKKVSQEITILQQLSVHQKKNKDHVPDYLKYRDKGYMYFPCTELLSFLIAVDKATTEKIDGTNFSPDGSKILFGVVESLHDEPNIDLLFLAAVVAKVPRFDEHIICCC